MKKQPKPRRKETRRYGKNYENKEFINKQLQGK